MRMRRIIFHMRLLRLYIIFPHYLISGRIFGKSHAYNIFPHILQAALFSETGYWTQNVCFHFLYKLVLKHFSLWEEMSEIRSYIYIYMCVCVSSCKVCVTVVRFEWNANFHDILHKNVQNVKFHENTSSRSRVVPCAQPDLTKLTVAFRNFANAPKTEILKMSVPSVALQKKILFTILPGFLYYFELIPNNNLLPLVSSHICNCAVYEGTVSSLQEDGPKSREKIRGTAEVKRGCILARPTARGMVRGVGVCGI
jgi:hypothetical protein